MSTTRELTRRKFLQSASAVAAAQTFGQALHALTPRHEFGARSAWVAGREGVHCLHATPDGWQQAAFVACEAPAALALHPAGKLLYVAHATDTFQHLPTGSVSCYRIAPDGGLLPMQRQGLSLACTEPEALAISADASLLVVASRQTGVLNVLPLDSRGAIDAVTAARKEMAWINGKDEPLHMRFTENKMVVISRGESNALYHCKVDGLTLVSRDVAAVSFAQNALPSGLPEVLSELALASERNRTVWA